MPNEESCNHQCEGCSVKDCASRNSLPRYQTNALSHIQKTIAVISGKGGVGKSMVTSLLAVSLRNEGHTVAILDADVTGPSIPQAFGLKGMVSGSEDGIFPMESKKGIRIISANLLMENPTAPIVWRGSLISNFVGQLYTDVIYGDVEYLLIDMPPGTGDVPLTVFQSIPVNGVVVVSTPQDLVSLVVEKSVNMAKMMNIPIIGLVENMSYVLCPDCQKKIEIYGSGKTKKAAERYGLELLGELPIDPELTELVDGGLIDAYEGNYLEKAVKSIETL